MVARGMQCPPHQAREKKSHRTNGCPGKLRESLSQAACKDQIEMFDLSEIPKSPNHRLEFPGLKLPLWTQQKAKLISRYLHYFVLITKHGVYIDGFAGPQDSDQPDRWAAKLVLESEPRWMRSFFLCDKDGTQSEALEKLRESQPETKDRTINVACADFNTHVDEVLTPDNISEKTAAFCVLDQRTFECDWATVRKIACYKSNLKIEIFYFVPTGWLARSISALENSASTMARWWGNENWTCLKGMRGNEVAESFRQRFLQEFNYRFVYSWPIYKQQGSNRIMYYMVHATDHKDAPKLMYRAYRKAANRSEPAQQLNLELN